MKKALVLAGGGTRGAYQNGALKALRKLHKADFDIVTGTSIGALNAALVVQKDYKAMDNMWHTLTQDKIVKGSMTLEFNLDTMINERNLIASFFKNYVKEKGADISPLIEQIEYYFDEKKFFDSNIDFGCITVKHGSLKPEFVTKEMMKEHAIDWLVSSASAFPAFPVHTFSEGSFIDGGYYDNLPVDFALRLGADELIIIDLNNNPQHPCYMYSDNVHYIYPKKPTGSFLNFDRKVMDDLEIAGYNDTMKTFGKYDGIVYTFKKMKYPSYYHDFLRKFMMMENDIKVAAQINKKINFRSESYLRDRISESLHISCVSDKQIFFALIDELMKLCNLDDLKIWDYKDAQKAIVEHFMPCIKEDYAYLPKLVPTDIMNYISTLDEEGIVAKFVHFMAYEEHSPFKDGLYLTIYPFEKCLAMLVIEMMKDEIGEIWKKIAKFEKVSYEQFLEGLKKNQPELVDKAEEIYEGIALPKRATKGSAGYDFFAPFDIEINPNKQVLIPTGIRASMQEDYVLMLFPRSSLGFKYRLQLNNTVGIIDSDYYYANNEGHIFCKLTNDTVEDKVVKIEKGQGMVQGIFLQFGVTIDDEVSEERTGGIGSTTKKVGK